MSHQKNDIHKQGFPRDRKPDPWNHTDQLAGISLDRGQGKQFLALPVPTAIAINAYGQHLVTGAI
jgi:hypothetical protein